MRSLKTVPACGVEAWIESDQGAEHHLRVGQRELLLDLTNETELLSLLRRAPGDDLVYVEVDGRLRAIAAVRERMRDSAGEAMRWLKAQGIECIVMTGDRPERAARLLGPGHVRGGLTPQNKVDQIKNLGQAGHQTGFVGDGINDAPAMQAAFPGIALAHGAGVTTAGADAVLYGGDLRVIPWAVALARQVRGSIRSNLIFAAAYNAFGMALAATGFLHPVMSALLMVVSSFTVSWRALRSAECADDCCAAIPAPSPDPTTSPDGHRAARQWFQVACGILVIGQAPILVYLGQLGTTAAALTWAVMLGLGIFIVCLRLRTPGRTSAAHMIFAMLGPGNWGMILGWWAEQGFSLWSIAGMPWMNLGMLLFGLPPMLAGPANPRFGPYRFSTGLLSAAGMILGMSFGNFVFMKWFGPVVAESFLVSFTGMTTGMLLGMFLGCGFGRALALALARR
jgi:magnesium-transporting ATPase (P-type)